MDARVAQGLHEVLADLLWCLSPFPQGFEGCVWPLTWITTTSQPVTETLTWEISRRCPKILRRCWCLVHFFSPMGKNYTFLLHTGINKHSEEELVKILHLKVLFKLRESFIKCTEGVCSTRAPQPLWKGCDWSQVAAQVWHFCCTLRAWASLQCLAGQWETNSAELQEGEGGNPTENATKCIC